MADQEQALVAEYSPNPFDVGQLLSDAERTLKHLNVLPLTAGKVERWPEGCPGAALRVVKPVRVSERVERRRGCSLREVWAPVNHEDVRPLSDREARQLDARLDFPTGGSARRNCDVHPGKGARPIHRLLYDPPPTDPDRCDEQNHDSRYPY